MDVRKRPSSEDVETALYAADAGDAGHWPTVAGILADELFAVRQIITDYVNEVESGEKFGALVEAVPGLWSDDGMYGGS